MKTKKFSYKFFIRPSKALSDNVIYLRVIIDRKKKDISTAVIVSQNQWSDEIQSIIDVRNSMFNTFNLLKLKLIQHIDQAEQAQIKIDFDFFSHFFERGIKKQENFSDFVLHYLEDNSYRYGQETIHKYKNQLTKLSRFKSDVKLSDINEDFVLSYKRYMMSDLNNKLSTAGKSLIIVKQFIEMARKQGLVKTDPFANIKIQRPQGHRETLTIDELNLIVDFVQKTASPTYKNIGTYFLFSCFTGLRFGDLKKLQFNHINNGFIRLTQTKTKDPVSIPVNQKILNLIPKNKTDGLIFNVLSNQKTNKHLKTIAQLAGISKNVTSHVARHTFATTALTIGIPIEVVSKLLGHRDIKTTQIYAHVLDDLKIKEMDKFNLL